MPPRKIATKKAAVKLPSFRGKLIEAAQLNKLAASGEDPDSNDGQPDGSKKRARVGEQANDNDDDMRDEYGGGFDDSAGNSNLDVEGVVSPSHPMNSFIIHHIHQSVTT